MIHPLRSFRQSFRHNFSPKPLAANIAALIAVPALIQPVQAEEVRYEFSIPAGTLSKALTRLGDTANAKLLLPSELVAGLLTTGLSGNYTLQQALQQLLAGTELVYSLDTNSNSITLKRRNDQVMMLDSVRVGGKAEARFGDAPVEPGGFKAEYQTTATKMALSLKETPQAISVVTRDSLDARQVKDLSTAIELSAGNGGVRSGPGLFGGHAILRPRYILRGQEADIKSDGFRIIENTLDFSAYERIEVVKGPSGFYGQGSLGGFINLVRKKPEAEFGADISAQVGSYDTYRTEADITGSLTEAQNLRGRLTLAYEDAGSFVDDIENERVLVAPSLEVIVSDKTRILLQALYQKDTFNVNPRMPLDRSNGSNLQPYENLSSSRERLLGVVGEKSTIEIKEVQVRLDHEISDRWLTSLLLQSNKATRDMINGNAASVYNYNNYGYSLYSYAWKDFDDRDSWTGELRLQGGFEAFGQEHKLLLGIEHNENENDRVSGQIYSNIGLPETFSGNFDNYGFASKDDILNNANTAIEKTKNSALYAQGVFSLNDKTKLLVSARYDKASKDRAPESGASTDDSADDITARVGLTHSFNENISAYATYAESFEPTLREGRSGVVDPETGKGYELGLKSNWFNNNLGATLAVYQQDLENIAILDPSNARGENFYIASGKHRSDGVEIELSGSPYPGLTISAALAWMDNEFTESDDPFNGLSRDGSVDKQISLYANYEWQTGVLKGLSVGATMVKLGDRKYVNTSENLQPNYFQQYIEGYERFDINISYQELKNWDFDLQIRNITDETYIESAISTQGVYGSTRAALFKATYQF